MLPCFLLPLLDMQPQVLHPRITLLLLVVALLAEAVKARYQQDGEGRPRRWPPPKDERQALK